MWGRPVSALVLLLVILGISIQAFDHGPASVSPDPGALFLPPGPTPTDRVWYLEPEGRFRVLVPSDWSIHPASDGSVIWAPPTGNSNMGIRSKGWCTQGTASEAVAVLTDALTAFESDSGFNIVAPPSPRTINGHAGAESWFTLLLVNGKAYQTVAVILAPEWSATWMFYGLVHDASEMPLWSVMNETLDSFAVLNGPGPSAPLHSESHFQVSVPGGWHAQTNATVGGTIADVLLSDAKANVLVAIDSEPDSLRGTNADARAILQEAIHNLSSQPGFRVIEPVSDVSVDGHPGARALLTWQPSTDHVDTHVAVVVGAEWGRSWAIVGSALSQFRPEVRSCFDETLRTFAIDRVIFIQVPAGFFVRYHAWLLAAGLVATAVEGTVFAYLIVRASRRKP